MKWATRAKCHVDRTACAWLIRKAVTELEARPLITISSCEPDSDTEMRLSGRFLNRILRRRAFLCHTSWP